MRGQNDPSMRIQGGNPYAIPSTPMLCAADFSNYRGFQFGTNLAVAAEYAGMKPSETRLVHQRPALIPRFRMAARSVYRSEATW
jgi:hypothetical protein